jgi:hypothetical protein
MEISLLTYQIIFHTVTAITVLLQGYVIYAVQTKSPYSMKSYKLYLINFSCYDILFTVIYGVFFIPDPTGKLLSVRSRGLSAYISPEAQILSVKALNSNVL